MPAYRNGYRTNYVWIRLIENWRNALDNNLFSGAMLMDFWRAFNCIPYDLLIAKLHAYGLGFHTLIIYLRSYLRDREENVGIDNMYNLFKLILSGLPQDVILGPVLFNEFLHDLFLWLQNSDSHNFADDITISATCKNINDCLRTLENEAEQVIDCFNINRMIANPDKVLAILLSKTDGSVSHKLNMYDNIIDTTKLVTLLGVEIDHQLRFNQHISTLCPKTPMELDALSRLQRVIGRAEKSWNNR